MAGFYTESKRFDISGASTEMVSACNPPEVETFRHVESQ